MGLLSAVASRLEPKREPQETFAYQCGRCGTTFERPKTRMTRIRCPDCGASAVYAASEVGDDEDTAGENES
jgi:DNA-directed RNA polymerase subunit RPC12/RpoP